MAKNTISLITGIGGFVASHLARYLLEQGEEVYGTYRWNEDLSRIKDIKAIEAKTELHPKLKIKPTNIPQLKPLLSRELIPNIKMRSRQDSAC